MPLGAAVPDVDPRVRMSLTWTGDHTPPRAVATPRAVKARATPCKQCAKRTYSAIRAVFDPVQYFLYLHGQLLCRRMNTPGSGNRRW